MREKILSTMIVTSLAFVAVVVSVTVFVLLANQQNGVILGAGIAPALESPADTGVFDEIAPLSEPILPVCNDTDDGQNYTILGTVSGNDNTGTNFTYNDSCNNGLLTEYYCRPTLLSEIINCTDIGYDICFNGVCDYESAETNSGGEVIVIGGDNPPGDTGAGDLPPDDEPAGTPTITYIATYCTSSDCPFTCADDDTQDDDLNTQFETPSRVYGENSNGSNYDIPDECVGNTEVLVEMFCTDLGVGQTASSDSYYDDSTATPLLINAAVIGITGFPVLDPTDGVYPPPSGNMPTYGYIDCIDFGYDGCSDSGNCFVTTPNDDIGTSPFTCTDSDGLDFTNKGYTSGTNNGFEYTNDDKCSNPTTLAEAICGENNIPIFLDRSCDLIGADLDSCDSGICFVSDCGNTIIEGPEECDDGNMIPGDGCNDCQLPIEAVCGNDAVEFGETCDDGNTDNGDGCSSECQNEAGPETCGNQIVDNGEDGTLDLREECDAGDGNWQRQYPCIQDGYDGTKRCREGLCKFEICSSGEYCGDNTINGNEACDDGNTDSFDGCSDICETETIPEYTLEIGTTESSALYTNAGVNIYGILTSVATEEIITNAECTIIEDELSYSMTFDFENNRYISTRSYSSEGTVLYTVSCDIPHYNVVITESDSLAITSTNVVVTDDGDDSGGGSGGGGGGGGGAGPGTTTETNKVQDEETEADEFHNALESENSEVIRTQAFVIETPSGIDENEQLKEILKKVYNEELNEKELKNIKTLSNDLVENFVGERQLRKVSGKTVVTITMKNLGEDIYQDLIIFEIIPKEFASHTDQIKIITNGIVEIVNPDPEYIIKFKNVQPQDELLISYEIDNEINAEVVEEFDTEIYTNDKPIEPAEESPDELIPQDDSKSFSWIIATGLVLIGGLIIGLLFFRRESKPILQKSEEPQKPQTQESQQQQFEEPKI